MCQIRELNQMRGMREIRKMHKIRQSQTFSQIYAPGFQIGLPHLMSHECPSEWVPQRLFVAHVLGDVLRSAQIISDQCRSTQDSSDLYAQTPDRPLLAAVTGNNGWSGDVVE